eukprot:GHVU01179119.1.p2 GENE.GHVU01179119.1~~GHVU01179119.1.p2  ORF type:complete len:322 (-),score=61.76 GHVU01179119.1:627-1592(-)
MGKSEGNAVHLDPAATPPNEFWNFFRNVPDDKLGEYVSMFTTAVAAANKAKAPALDDVDDVSRRGLKTVPAQLNEIKEWLANEMTARVHSASAAETAKAVARRQHLWGGGGSGIRETQRLSPQATASLHSLSNASNETAAVRGIDGSSEALQRPPSASSSSSSDDSTPTVSAEFLRDLLLQSQVGSDFQQSVLRVSEEELEAMGPMVIPRLLKGLGLCASIQEGKRLMAAGAVRVNGALRTDPKAGISANDFLQVRHRVDEFGANQSTTTIDDSVSEATVAGFVPPAVKQHDSDDRSNYTYSGLMCLGVGRKRRLGIVALV